LLNKPSIFSFWVDLGKFAAFGMRSHRKEKMFVSKNILNFRVADKD